MPFGLADRPRFTACAPGIYGADCSGELNALRHADAAALDVAATAGENDLIWRVPEPEPANGTAGGA